MGPRTAPGVRPLTAADAGTVARLLETRWGGTETVSRGAVHDAARAPGFLAERAGRVVGLATYVVGGAEAELLTLDALVPRVGIGTALLGAVATAAAASGARRLVLVTTNDNTGALAFYARHGFDVVAVHRGAVDRARRHKPTIPLVGHGGIEVHDEIELARTLDP